jgi:hypothetical protein
MNSMPNKAKFVVLAVVLLAAAFAVYSVLGEAGRAASAGNLRFVSLLVLATISSRMKVRLPGIESNISMNLPFILVALIELALLQALIITAGATFAQCLPGSDQRKLKPVQIVFNVCTLCNAVAIAFLAATAATHTELPAKPVFLAVAAVAFFFADTVPVAGIIATTSNGQLWKLWIEISRLTLPYFVLSAGTATMVAVLGHYLGFTWPALLLVMYAVYRSFQRYFGHSVVHTQPVAAAAHGARAVLAN